VTKRKTRSDKGKVRVPAGSGGIRIVEVPRDPIDLDKLAAALLMLARQKAADESHKTDLRG